MSTGRGWPKSSACGARGASTGPPSRPCTTADGITSLSPQTGPPARLLALKRGHGVSENGLHRVKDVTLSEDHRVIHQGQGPTVMALRRDAAVSLLRRASVRQIAARLRYPSHHPAAAVALLGDPPVTHA